VLRLFRTSVSNGGTRGGKWAREERDRGGGGREGTWAEICRYARAVSWRLCAVITSLAASKHREGIRVPSEQKPWLVRCASMHIIGGRCIGATPTACVYPWGRGYSPAAPAGGPTTTSSPRRPPSTMNPATGCTPTAVGALDNCSGDTRSEVRRPCRQSGGKKSASVKGAQGARGGGRVSGEVVLEAEVPAVGPSPEELLSLSEMDSTLER